MEISKEQKEAIEYLEKYTKWETYGERNLEKDIITVLELLNETQIKNETLEELLQGNLYEMYKYYRDLANSYQGNCISKEKIKDKIKELNSRIEKYREYVEQGIGTDVEWVDNVADRETVKVLQELLEESE